MELVTIDEFDAEFRQLRLKGLFILSCLRCIMKKYGYVDGKKCSILLHGIECDVILNYFWNLAFSIIKPSPSFTELVCVKDHFTHTCHDTGRCIVRIDECIQFIMTCFN